MGEVWRKHWIVEVGGFVASEPTEDFLAAVAIAETFDGAARVRHFWMWEICWAKPAQLCSAGG